MTITEMDPGDDLLRATYVYNEAGDEHFLIKTSVLSRFHRHVELMTGIIPRDIAAMQFRVQVLPIEGPPSKTRKVTLLLNEFNDRAIDQRHTTEDEVIRAHYGLVQDCELGILDTYIKGLKAAREEEEEDDY